MFGEFLSTVMITAIYYIFAFLVWGLLTTFYSMSLMKALKIVPEKNRTMSPGLAFLGFIPFLGTIWHAIFAIITIVKLKQIALEKGQSFKLAFAAQIIHASVLVIGFIAYTILNLSAFISSFRDASSSFGQFDIEFNEDSFPNIGNNAFQLFNGLYNNTMIYSLILNAITLPSFLLSWISIGALSGKLKQDIQAQPKTELESSVIE